MQVLPYTPAWLFVVCRAAGIRPLVGTVFEDARESAAVVQPGQQPGLLRHPVLKAGSRQLVSSGRISKPPTPFVAAPAKSRSALRQQTACSMLFAMSAAAAT